MTESTHVANYMLESILRDLNFLKENNFLPAQTYRDVVSILPSRIESNNNENSYNRPPLPIRKSTNSSNSNLAAPVPQPRSISNEYPKLPTRKTGNNDWQQPSPAPSPAQLPAMIMPSVTKNILQHSTTPEPAPPAYTQKPPANEPLATAEALYDYQGEDPTTDLSFKQGNIIEVTEYVNDDWWKGTVQGRSGIFPQNHVKKIAPSMKPKRPWATTTSTKPSFSTNSNTPYTQTQQPSSMQQPYSYPPPPAMYQAPPIQPPAQSYAQPSAVPVVEGGGEGDNKVQNMAKKFGGHVATAATWGFGATLGSEAAKAIF